MPIIQSAHARAAGSLESRSALPLAVCWLCSAALACLGIVLARARERLTRSAAVAFFLWPGMRPAPFAAAYRDWTEDPYGGGVNFWQIHARSWEVMQAIVHPRDDVPVYICGEAYSQEQGWVEGALQTAEIMLQKHFGLTPPPPMVPPLSAAEQAHRVLRSKRAKTAKAS